MRKALCLFFIFFPIFLAAQQSYNMTLLGQLDYDDGVNDVWGYADQQGNEYALVGLVNGTSFVDVTNPAHPVEKAYIPGPTSTWRDLKTWGNYAYVVHDTYSGDLPSQGLLIVNLKDLAVGEITYSSFYFDGQLTNAHNIYIDENGCVYLFGGNYAIGGALMFDVSQDPENPVYLGVFDAYYLHDGMVRGDTLWGAAIHEGVVAAIDVSDKSAPVILGSTFTPGNFTHNAWISDDGNYVFTTDEITSGYIAAVDVSNVADMSVIDQIQSWSPQDDVIPHNTHVKGNFLVNSYYCDGVTVVDASDPFNLQEVAYYDTSDSTGGTSSGAWGAYPWLPSNRILVTDRQKGLHILSVDNIEFSAENLDAFLDVQIYPNPSADVFTIDLENVPWQLLSVSDINGRYLESYSNSGNQRTLILGENWLPSVYLVEIEDADGLRITYKIIKE